MPIEEVKQTHYTRSAGDEEQVPIRSCFRCSSSGAGGHSWPVIPDSSRKKTIAPWVSKSAATRSPAAEDRLARGSQPGRSVKLKMSASPVALLSCVTVSRSEAMSSLGDNSYLAPGSLSSIYQQGQARTVQLALKLEF